MDATVIRLGETTIISKHRGSRVRTVAVFTRYQPAQFVRVRGKGIDTHSSPVNPGKLWNGRKRPMKKGEEKYEE